jgi:hypothetical protein
MKATCTPNDSEGAKMMRNPETKTVNVISEDILRKILYIISCFKEEIRAIPEVSKIAYLPKGTLLTFWTFTDTDDKRVLRQIYKVEQKIRDAFPDFIFDFTVIFDSKEEAPVNFFTDFIR